MRKVRDAFVVAILSAGLAVAADNSRNAAVMNTVNQFVKSFNKADTKMMLQTCSYQASIIDDFPPHAWKDCSSWLHDYDAYAKKNGVVNGTITLGEPRRVDVTADWAYVVVPATFASMHRGKPFKEPPSTLTVVLQESATGWHVTGWAWSEG
jgi:hypothetical protein